MQINRLVIQLLVKKRSQTAHLRRKTSLRVTLLRTTLFSGCYWCDQYEKKKIKKKFGSLYQQQWALPAEPLKKWRSGRITTLTQKKKKPQHVPVHQQKDRTHQCESGDAGARSPRWVSGFYNWRLPHQWCCSAEGSRHLYAPVGIRIIA